jgi:hypothetical protein
MDIDRHKLLRALITEDLWKRLSLEEVRLYLLIISIDATKKTGKQKNRILRNAWDIVLLWDN